MKFHEPEKSFAVKYMAEVDFLVKLRDAACIVKDACEERLEKLAPVETRDRTTLPFDASKIPWREKQGDKGPFQLSDSYDNPEHQKLLAFVQQHAGGAITSQGFYYWIFPDSKTIGRKPSNQIARK